jgi:hypothetical protein
LWPIRNVTAPAMIGPAASTARPSSCFASRILDPAHGIRADKAAEIADRIYQCNAAGGGGTGEKASWEGPEGGDGRIHAHRTNGESNSRKDMRKQSAPSR